MEIEKLMTDDIEFLDLTGVNPLSGMFLDYWIKGRQNNDQILNNNITEIKDRINTDRESNLKHILVKLSSDKKIETIIFGNGEPLLLVPGLGVTAPIWVNQLDFLSKYYQVIIIHKPGHGLSETTDDLSYNGISCIFNEVLERLSINGPINVLGACIGGLVALNFASKFPSSISKLIIVGAIIDWDTDVFDDSPLSRTKVKAMMKFLNTFEKSLKSDYYGIISEVFKNCDVQEYEKVCSLYDKSKSIDPLAYVQYVMDITKGEKINNLLNRIKCPTLIMTGNKDSVVHYSNARKLNNLIRGSEYNEIDGAGHYSYISHYKEFNEKVNCFLQGRPAFK